MKIKRLYTPTNFGLSVSYFHQKQKKRSGLSGGLNKNLDSSLNIFGAEANHFTENCFPS